MKSIRQAPFAFALLALPFAACDKPGPAAATPEEIRAVADEHRAAAEAKLAAYEEIGRALATIPPLEQSGVQTPDPPARFGLMTNPAWNAATFHAEDLQDVTKPGGPDVRVISTWFLAEAASLVRKGTGANGQLPRQLSMVRLAFDQLARSRYLLVLRTRRYAAPQVTGRTSFTGGSCEIEALLFDLESRRCLGGFVFEARNSEVVGFQGQEVQEYTLRSDLAANALTALNAAVPREIPGAQILMR